MASAKDSNKKDFPRTVYKKGTGRQVNDSGLYEAQSMTVHDEKQLADLGKGWVETPQDAAAGNKDAHGEKANITVKADNAVIEKK